MEDLIERGNADANGLENTRKGFLLTILTIAASAFPEPVCMVSSRYSPPSRILKPIHGQNHFLLLTTSNSIFFQWCEVIWRDVEEDLWEVVESTCLPVLGVLDRDDVESFLEAYLR